MIPLIPSMLHFIWIGGAMPIWAIKNVDQFKKLNPTYDVRIHGEDVLLSEFENIYKDLRHLASKADLLRLSALRKFGGWYFDVDFVPFRPLDDAIRAWGLDDERMFICRQQGHLSGERLPFANAPMACCKHAPGLRYLCKLARMKTINPARRVTFGPELVKEAISHFPSMYHISEAAWWFPLSIAEAKPVVEKSPEEWYRMDLRSSGTGGQRAFATHLWNGAHNITDKTDAKIAVIKRFNPAALKHPLRAVSQGLQELGYYVVPVDNPKNIKAYKPQVIVTWNHLRDVGWRRAADECGAKFIVAEHGFFNRSEFTQIDSAGFSHSASWKKDLYYPAPEEGDLRLREHYPDGVKMMRSRRDGIIWICGQLDGDSQLFESEIQTAQELYDAVAGAMHQHPYADAIFRPHPLNANSLKRSVWLPVQDRPEDAPQTYMRNKQAPTFADALTRARFVVAINSNAINEALATGVPCLAFGPHLGIDAGVVKKTTRKTFTRDFRAMVEGWAPEPDSVKNYLKWLACRQYSLEELASGEPLKACLATQTAEATEHAHS